MSDIIPDSSKKLLKWITDNNDSEASDQEKLNIAYIVMEYLFNIDKVEIITDRSINLSKSQWKELNKLMERLNKNEPIQYITGQADFYGRKFMVSPSVLIPRNETEELVKLIADDYSNKKIRLLDIGTGTGCIPITIAKELKLQKIHAIDFDPRVMKVARHNAEKHHVDLDIMMIDVLKESIPLQGLDVVVSNPPYVTESEKQLMHKNVLDYEPYTALFVSNDEPLIFYEKIAEQGLKILKEEGRLYFEINERFGEKIKFMLREKGYRNITVIQDINGKDRIIKALKSFS